MVCHVLLIETDAGLVLVDAGFGVLDCAEPGRRLGLMRHTSRPVLDYSETAAFQVETMGFQRSDVRHIITTHFDYDHIGGLADFPDATVHATTAELDGAVRSPSRSEQRRFRAIQWEHRPHLVEYAPRGESWRGFEAVRELDEVAPGIALVFLPGHTRGHAGVVVDAGERWVLHTGDAFFARGEVDAATPIPWAARVAKRMTVFDREKLAANLARLTELWHEGDPGLMIVNSHDPALLERAQSG